MKTALITGMHGMIAPKVASNLERRGIRWVAWDRTDYPEVDDVGSLEYLGRLKPDYIFHLAYGPIAWTKLLAKFAFEHNIVFAYISTMNVYGDTKGPLTKDSVLKPNDEYSKYKAACENSVNLVNKNAFILRLGWQIDEVDVTHPNNMVSYIESTKDKHHEIFGNCNSYISASFNADSSKKIVDIVCEKPSGLYLINSNLNLNFTQLLKAVIRKYQIKAKVIDAKGEEKNWLMEDPEGFIPWEF
ncbi:MAG: sugar nucleotide-binding protein [Acholeplasmatales bacterium]|jgi:dTDP-4-dehydrorhamnose reductase|nr:sugar nucleotide-binding protein [Acholeplasmatales bacterium]